MVAVGYAQDDKVNRSGDVMTGPLHFEGTPPFTVISGLHAGTVTLNGTNAVTVSTIAVGPSSLVFLTATGSAPAGVPYVASIAANSGFTVKSTSASDTAVTVGWAIVTVA